MSGVSADPSEEVAIHVLVDTVRHMDSLRHRCQLRLITGFREEYLLLLYPLIGYVEIHQLELNKGIYELFAACITC